MDESNFQCGFVCVYFGHHSARVILQKHCIQGALVQHPCLGLLATALKVQGKEALIILIALQGASDANFQLFDVRAKQCWSHRADL